MPDVFISYSRLDKDFVLKLHSQFTREDRNAWVDWEDIPLTADWWKTIQDGIASADNFVFVISPNSIQSEVCRNEIQYAVDNNKRIVPLLFRPITNPQDQAKIHPAIAAHNWVMFDDDSKFIESYDRLIEIITHGLNHIHMHTRLLIRARDWEQAGRSPALLMDARNLKLAEQWLTEAKIRQPHPTELQREFISASVKALRRSRIVRSSITGVLGVAGLLVIIALMLVILRLVLLIPYRDALNSLRERTDSFRVLRVNNLLELAVDGIGEETEFTTLENTSPYTLHAALTLYDPDYFESDPLNTTEVTVELARLLTTGETQKQPSAIATLLAQNLVLNAEFVTDYDWSRRAEELIVAAEIEQVYSKQEVLEFLLNDLYFGNQAYGISAAASWYFDKSPTEINLAEAAFLLGMSVNPPLYDPGVDFGETMEQFRRTIDQMINVNRSGCLRLNESAQDFCITYQDQRTSEYATSVAQIEVNTYQTRSFALAAPHFVNLIERELYSLYGNQSFYNEALRVETAFELDMQEVAERVVAEAVTELEDRGVNNAVFMATRASDGAIMALVGSIDPANARIGNAAFDWRDAGGIMQPIVYLTAFTPDQQDAYWYPGSIVWDVPTSFPDPSNRPYMPRNFDGLFRGPVSIRHALANSINVPAVRMLNTVGLERFTATATELGFRFERESGIGLAATISGQRMRLFDLARGFGTIANGGLIAEPHTIVRIIDRDGRVIYEAPSPRRAAVAPESLFFVTSILTDRQASMPGFGDFRARLGEVFLSDSIAIRTGTSLTGQSAWITGYTNDVVGTFWMGSIDDSPMINTSGLTAATYWAQPMTVAFERFPPQPFEAPPGVELVHICGSTGTFADPSVSCPGLPTGDRLEYVRSDTPPRMEETGLKLLKIDSTTGSLAGVGCPNPFVERLFLIPEDQAILDWVTNENAGQSWAKNIGLTLPLEIPPTVVCTSS